MFNYIKFYGFKRWVKKYIYHPYKLFIFTSGHKMLYEISVVSSVIGLVFYAFTKYTEILWVTIPYYIIALIAVTIMNIKYKIISNYIERSLCYDMIYTNNESFKYYAKNESLFYGYRIEETLSHDCGLEYIGQNALSVKISRNSDNVSDVYYIAEIIDINSSRIKSSEFIGKFLFLNKIELSYFKPKC